MSIENYDEGRQHLAVLQAKAMVEAKRGSPPDDRHWLYGQADKCRKAISYHAARGTNLQCWHRG